MDDSKFIIFHKCMEQLPCGHYCQDTEINCLSGKMECSPCRKSKDYYSYPCGHSIVIYCGAQKPPSDACSKCEEIFRSLAVQFAGLLIDAPNAEDYDESDLDSDQSDRGVSDLDYDGDESNCDDADELSDLETDLADLDYDGGDESNCDSEDDDDESSHFDTDLSDLEYDGGNGSNCDSNGAY